MATAPPSERPSALVAVAALASIGAGAIHATAAGAHSEHRAAVVVAFALTAVFQIGWGALVLVRPSRAVALLGVAGNAAAVGGWVLAKTSGIGFVTGLDVREDPQFADTLAAALAVVAVIGALFVLRSRTVRSHERPAACAGGGVGGGRDSAHGAGHGGGREPQPRRRP